MTPEALLIDNTHALRNFEDIGYIIKLSHHLLLSDEPALYDSVASTTE